MPTIDPRLSGHKVTAGKVTGSWVGIIDADTAHRAWGNPALKPGDEYYRAERVMFADETEAAGGVLIHVYLQNATGGPVIPGHCWFGYPAERLQRSSWLGGIFDNGGQHDGDVFVYAGGEGAIAQGPNNFNPATATSPGPYAVAGFGLPSDVVYGFGLPGNRHVEYFVVFQRARWKEESVPVPPSQPPSEPTPNPAPTPTPIPAPNPTQPSPIGDMFDKLLGSRKWVVGMTVVLAMVIGCVVMVVTHNLTTDQALEFFKYIIATFIAILGTSAAQEGIASLGRRR
jgi:hypothetical protein